MNGRLRKLLDLQERGEGALALRTKPKKAPPATGENAKPKKLVCPLCGKPLTDFVKETSSYGPDILLVDLFFACGTELKVRGPSPKSAIGTFWFTHGCGLIWDSLDMKNQVRETKYIHEVRAAFENGAIPSTVG